MLTHTITINPSQTVAPAPDPQPPALTEGEAVALAAEALRELVETKYPYTERVFKILGQERIPPAIKEQQARRERLLAAAAVLEGMVQW